MKKLLPLIAALGLSMSLGMAYAADKDPTPQQQKMTACNKDAKGKKGDERKTFLKSCLSADKMGAMGEKSDAASAPMVGDKDPAATDGSNAAKTKMASGTGGKADAASAPMVGDKDPAATTGANPKTAQQNKMTMCNKDATGKKGDERKKFMSECLKG